MSTKRPWRRSWRQRALGAMILPRAKAVSIGQSDSAGMAALPSCVGCADYAGPLDSECFAGVEVNPFP